MKNFCARVFAAGTFVPDNPGFGGIFGCSGDGAAANLAIPLNSLGALKNPGQNPQPAIQKTLFTGQNIIYVFNHYSDYQALFQGAPAPNVAEEVGDNGYTYPTDSGITYSILIEHPIVGQNGPIGAPFTEIATHEEGHAVDYIEGWANQSGNTAFDTAMQNDWVYLNYSVVGTTLATSTKRNPCGTTAKDGYVGPLTGLGDPSTTGTPQFCTGNVIESKWTGALVSTILQTASIGNGWFKKQASEAIGQKTYPGGWLEWYAQSFAIQANQDTGGSGGAPIQDGVVQNGTGYFACTSGPTGWLASVYAGKTPTPASTCISKNLPSWWKPIT